MNKVRISLLTPPQAQFLLIECERKRCATCAVWIGSLRQEYTLADLRRIAAH